MKIKQRLLLLIGVVLLAAPITAPATDNGGQQLYQTHCSRCHGIDGQGLRRLYPVLQGSSYFGQKLMQLPCIVQNGLTGNIRLQDGTYNRTMPGNRLLDADQIARLMRYTSRFTTGESAATTTITSEEVAHLLQQCQ